MLTENKNDFEFEKLKSEFEFLKYQIEELKKDLNTCVDNLYKVQGSDIHIKNLCGRLNSIEENQKEINEQIDKLRDGYINNALKIKELSGLVQILELSIKESLNELAKLSKELEEVKNKKPISNSSFSKDLFQKITIAVISSILIPIIFILLISFSEKLSLFFSEVVNFLNKIKK